MIAVISPSISALVILVSVLIPAVSWLGFYHTSAKILPKARHRLTTIVFGVVLFLLWFFVMVLGMQNFFNPLVGTMLFPPVPNAAFLGAPLILGFGLLAVWPAFRTVLNAIPQSQLLWIQATRVIGGVFLILYAQRVLPGVFAIPAGLGDVLTGIAAPIVAYVYLRKQWGHRWLLLGWNLFGLADLMLAITLGFMASPGPLQRLATEFPVHEYGVVAAFPLVLIPAFLVPLAIFTHVISLRNLRKEWPSRQNEHVSFASEVA